MASVPRPPRRAVAPYRAPFGRRDAPPAIGSSCPRDCGNTILTTDEAAVGTCAGCLSADNARRALVEAGVRPAPAEAGPPKPPKPDRGGEYHAEPWARYVAACPAATPAQREFAALILADPTAYAGRKILPSGPSPTQLRAAQDLAESALYLKIGRVLYDVRVVPPSQDRECRDLIILIKGDETRYEVARTFDGPECSCPDFTFARDGAVPKKCKHILALEARGLLGQESFADELVTVTLNGRGVA